MVRSIAAALSPALPQLRDHLRRIIHAAILAVDPPQLLTTAYANGAFAFLSSHPVDLIAAGKAASGMAGTAADLLEGRIRRALIVGPRTSDLDWPADWQHIEAAHPFPDTASVEAGRAALAIAQAADDRPLLVLLSGGASSMVCAPSEPVTLPDKVAITHALMDQGVSIHDLNCVRKHLSDVKGGRLGAVASSSLTLAISDVHHPVEDDPSVIGSGPTVADPTTFAQALEIVGRARSAPRSVVQHLRNGAAGQVAETIKPADPLLSNAWFLVIGNRRTALRAAADAAAALGYAVRVIDEPTHGESRLAARAFLTRALQETRNDNRPTCVLAAGETTVRIVGHGRGGRNQEFALALVSDVAEASLRRFDPHTTGSLVLASVGTDGIDGPTPAAGAIVDSRSFDRARAMGLDSERSLADNDAYTFFDALGDLVVLGPTGTNVGDLQVVLMQ